MTRMFLLAGAAALAIAMPASAEKGGHGGGHGGGNGHGAQGEHGGGNWHGDRAEHGGGNGRGFKFDKGERRGPRADWRGGWGGFDEGPRGRKAERRADRRDFERRRDRFDDRRAFVERRRERPERIRPVEPRFTGFDTGCPPGLAKKNNGCMPPGQAKRAFAPGDRVDRSWLAGSALPGGYRDLYYDSPDYYYRYDNAGNIYRVDARNNLISGLIPLVGGDFLPIGQRIAAGFDNYNLPAQYRDLFPDSDDSLYRYDDNAIYQVDPQSGTIESIVALLTGGLNVGEPLPAGYDAYNLPLDYRDDYVDGDDYLYRYGNGNIYQVDAKTQIIKSIVEMLV